MTSPREFAVTHGRHWWIDTGRSRSACVDPPTTREFCQFCGAECWHWHGIPDGPHDSCRWREEGRAKTEVPFDEPCPKARDQK